MKIDNNLSGIRSSRPGKPRSEQGKAEASTTRTPSLLQGESVDITSTSARLQALEAALTEVDSQDIAKIEAIRQAIAEGRFQVDEDAVAEGLIQDTLALLRGSVR
jgi:negative regulator of flagellin synthesis FlgM